MSEAPLLIFGAGGQLGRELMALAHAEGVAAIGATRAQADIGDADAVARVIAEARPRLVVNAAAYTAVDKAEGEPDLARAINAVAPGLLAEATAEAGIPLLHISTDYVFDGRKTGAYTEEDAIAPLGVYGRTKAEGEARVRAANPRHVILRTAWVYGIHGHNFLKTMLRLARERDELRVVADQHGCPTATLDLARAILAVDKALRAGRDAFGTYHFVGTGRTSWHGFAQVIVAAQAGATGRRPAVTAIATADYPTPARRPANSELDASLFARTFGYRAEAWQTRTREVVQTLTAQHEAQPHL
jgi:dTDP-4-dehydrorhamnose reductase